ncbi:MAG: DUF4476 domain-containing protein [Ferruginibacter sp.]
MNRNFIKFRFSIFLSILLSMGVQGQKPRFVYIQSQDNQPFYVKIDKNSFNSSATGYMIIPKLTENFYQLTIGFPKNEWPEQDATINLTDSSAGYFLKKLDSAGWSLINLQTPVSKIVPYPETAGNKPEIIPIGGEFARVLAEVVNDSSIAWKTVTRELPASATQAEPIQQNTTGEPPVLKTNSTELTVSTQPDSAIVFKSIEKIKADSTTGGLSLIYVDRALADEDTIKIFIAGEEGKKEYEVPGRTVLVDTIAIKTDSRFIDMELQNPNKKADSGVVINDFVITERKQNINNTTPDAIREKETAAESVMINSDCRSNASEHDFMELRKQMASKKSEKEMIKVASRQFGKKCFTTGQVKNLGVLFISEEEKLGFYKAVFPRVSDSHNFKTLEDQFTGAEFRTRFRALQGH